MARFSLAEALRGAGMRAEETEALKQVLRIDPECSPTAERLRRLLPGAGS